jgi:PhnB protein
VSETPTLVPYFVVNDAAAAIDFYKAAFAAHEQSRYAAPHSTRIMHAHLKINDGDLMLSDDFSADRGGKSETALALGGSPVTIALEVDDAHGWWDRAVSAGATVIMPLADQFWAARYGQLVDPFGIKWSISQTIATPSDDEMTKAASESFSG